MIANEIQVGGDHYKLDGKGEEHWDRVWRMSGRGYFVGCITKYVERYHKKNGVEDLKKARHFLDKLIELESADKDTATTPTDLSYWKQRSEKENIVLDGTYMDGAATYRCTRCRATWKLAAGEHLEHTCAV